MDEEIKHLLSLNSNEKKFYEYLLFLINVYDINTVNKYLEKFNVQYSNLKLQKFFLLGIKSFYEDIVNQKKFSCDSSYELILKTYIDFGNKIGIKTPLEKCIYFNKLLKNGYLSRYKFLKYDADAYDDFYGPYIVFSGKGCCRNFAMMLNDFLHFANIKSDLNANCFKAYDNSILDEIIGNHLCVTVEDDKFDFIYDPTCDEVLYHNHLHAYKSLGYGDKYLNRSKNVTNYNVATKKNYEELKVYYNDSLTKITNLLNQYQVDLDQVYEELKPYFLEIYEYLCNAKKGYMYVNQKSLS